MGALTNLSTAVCTGSPGALPAAVLLRWLASLLPCFARLPALSRYTSCCPAEPRPPPCPLHTLPLPFSPNRDFSPFAPWYRGTAETNDLYWGWYCDQTDFWARLLKGILQGERTGLCGVL